LAKPLYIAELLPVGRVPVKGGAAVLGLRRPAGMRSTLDRVAGGKTIARKKRFGPAWISTGGHEPGLIVLYPRS